MRIPHQLLCYMLHASAPVSTASYRCFPHHFIHVRMLTLRSLATFMLLALRVPETPQWVTGSLRPRTWMPTCPLITLTEWTRPQTFGELLWDMSLWRYATTIHGVESAFVPAYTTSGQGPAGNVWQADLWRWSLGHCVETIETQLRLCEARPSFDVRFATARRVVQGSSLTLHPDGVLVTGFYLREEDVPQWTASHRVSPFLP